MNKAMMAGWMLAGALGIAVANPSCAQAQTALGGAKLQQNKIGGVAKPAPVVGGAAPHVAIAPQPPGPVVGNRSASPTPNKNGNALAGAPNGAKP